MKFTAGTLFIFFSALCFATSSFRMSGKVTDLGYGSPNMQQRAARRAQENANLHCNGSAERDSEWTYDYNYYPLADLSYLLATADFFCQDS